MLVIVCLRGFEIVYVPFIFLDALLCSSSFFSFTRFIEAEIQEKRNLDTFLLFLFFLAVFLFIYLYYFLGKKFL